ncbi:hypothetical protein FF38_07848 [Lucilia cuprina]|uniref:Uncharacterized protein n=1 Tax=Lucilia cuprina TaxID=7375 RepID=A0A0L0BXS2_LUCCU|nr:hypothetical protein FF38_07848 [Lucilia cuprina]
MSRKRMSAVRLFSNGIPTPYNQVHPYEYYRPGCYYIPQVEHQVTPYTHTYSDHWQPYCNTATYVVDCFGRVNYPSDFEYQLQVPTTTFMQSPPREVLYQYYDNGEAEIASLPQIEEEDSVDDQDVFVSKRKRFNHEDRLGNERALKKSNRKKLKQNNYVYRSNEGYLVEEPSDNVCESI